jgi:hypothetical protein
MSDGVYFFLNNPVFMRFRYLSILADAVSSATDTAPQVEKRKN